MGLFARTKSILTISLVAALCSLSVFGFLAYRIVGINKATAELSENMAKEEKRNQQLRTLQDLLEELGAEEAALDGRFLSSEGLVPFIELVEDVGRDAGVTVEVVSVGIQPESEAGASHEWLKVALKAEGSWAEVFHFVRMLETMPYAIKLDQAGISREQTEKGPASWQGAIVLRAAKLKTQP